MACPWRTAHLELARCPLDNPLPAGLPGLKDGPLPARGRPTWHGPHGAGPHACPDYTARLARWRMPMAGLPSYRPPTY